jgi:hypothetical protein
LLKQHEFHQLIDKFLGGRADDDEAALLIKYYNRLQAKKRWNQAELGSSREMGKKMLERLFKEIHSEASNGIKKKDR